MRSFGVRIAFLVLAGASPIVCGAAKQSAFANQSKPMKATVRILAVSSSSRQNFAGNQEVYLADVQVKNGQHEFVRLIDQYPGFGLPIQASLMHSQTVFKMQVTREPECDVTGAEVFLRPGDSAVYDASVRDSLASRRSQMIPCYKTLHQTVQIAKK